MRRLCLALAALLALPTHVAAEAAAPAETASERRVADLVSQLTLEEKLDMLGGVVGEGFDVPGVPRIGLPVMHTADGPFGVRRLGRSNAMAGCIALAATWNTELSRRVGEEVGRDARARGVHFYLAPGVNLYRSSLNGRNFEYLGEGPWLAARMAVPLIEGVQAQGVAATIKHYMGNNSEFLRHASDSVIDERTMREIYLPAFEAAVKEARRVTQRYAWQPESIGDWRMWGGVRTWLRAHRHRRFGTGNGAALKIPSGSSSGTS